MGTDSRRVGMATGSAGPMSIPRGRHGGGGDDHGGRASPIRVDGDGMDKGRRNR